MRHIRALKLRRKAIAAWNSDLRLVRVFKHFKRYFKNVKRTYNITAYKPFNGNYL
jgi:hypothetical protein